MIKDYRDIIRQCHEERMSANPRYSLRAYARDLDISPSQLSLVLSKKKGLSEEKAKKVFKSILVDPEMIAHCLLQVRSEHARNPKSRDAASEQLKDLSQHQDSVTLTKDAFDTIGNWQHFAILQALVLKTVPKTKKKQMQWLSERLKLSMPEVIPAIDRLLRLELIKEENDRLSVCHETVLTTNGIPSTALRNFHRQLITKALRAIETQTVKERVLNSTLFPTKKENLPHLQEDIMQFQRSMMKKYGRVHEGDADCVYSISMQLFKIMESS